jgi:23S rRNA (cytosine1962-C5)-methyltransferase
VLATAGFPGYALIDSGGGRKLERFGLVVVDRPEPQALWRPLLEPGRWLRADASFKSSGEEDGEGGRWRRNKPVPEAWPVNVLGVTVLCRLTSFRHLGLFPEQLPHWEWMADWLRQGGGPARVLNLFAYTGAASLIAARAGAEVTHVDASKKAIAWARQNRTASKLDEAAVRWILEDARKFVARELRRGRSYHLILIDPPKFGRGPEGEVWRLEEHLAPLLADCRRLLDADSRFLVLTVYAVRMSALAIGELLRQVTSDLGGTVECGEMAIREEARGLLLPTAIFARWSR